MCYFQPFGGAEGLQNADPLLILSRKAKPAIDTPRLKRENAFPPPLEVNYGQSSSRP